LDATNEAVPCGLCGRTVPAAELASRAARLFQGTLYCSACAKEAERARQETTAFKHALVAGGLLTCARCDAPVPLADAREGRALYREGELACAACSSDLRSVLKVAPAKPAPLGKAPHEFLPFTFVSPFETPAPAPAQAERRTIAFDAVLPVPDSRETAPFDKVLPLPDQRPAAIPGETAQATAPFGKVLPLPASRCALCDAALLQEAESFSRGGKTYCAPCRAKIETATAESIADSARLANFLCGGCGTKVLPDDLVQDRAIRYQGSVYCSDCKKDFGRSKARTPEAPPAAALLPSVPCARCQRAIPPIDIRLGLTLELDGALHCRRCRQAIEEGRVHFEKEAARRIACSGCDRWISPIQIAAGNFVAWNGAHYCALCKRDPTLVLMGRRSEATPGKCRVCGREAASLEKEVCDACAEKLLKVEEFNLTTSEELKVVVDTWVCAAEGCSRRFTSDEIRAGKARFEGKNVSCAEHASRAPEKRVARCELCRKPLPERTRGKLCAECIADSSADAERTSAALALSGQVALRCSRCRAALAGADLASGRARSVSGRLLCRTCKGAVKRDPPSRTCPTCDEPIVEPAFVFAARSFCRGCEPVFEIVVAEAMARPPSGAPCTSCKKPASGPGALDFGAEVVCGSCTKVADFLVEYRVRERRTGRSRVPARKFAAVAVAVAAWVGFGVSLVHVLPENTREAPVVVAARPAAEPWLEKTGELSRLVGRAPTSYAQAVADLERATKLAQELKEFPACGATVAAALARARARRDAYAPGLAANAQARAAAAFGNGAGAPQAQAALAALDAFPAELAETPAAAAVRAARERARVFADCARRAAELPTSGGPRVAGLVELLRSSEARACDLDETALGRALASQVGTIAAEEAAREKQRASETAIADARAAEEKGDFARARELYASAVERDGSPAARLGLARALLSLDELVAARAAAASAVSADPTSNDARVLAAWLAFTDSDPGGHARASRALEGVGPGELGPLGRRLEALLGLGAPRLEGRIARVYEPGRAADRSALAAEIERAVERAASILDIPVDTRRVTLVFLPEAKLAAFGARLEVAGRTDPVPAGSYAVVLRADASESEVRRRAVESLARRRRDVPAWLRAALPRAFAGETPSVGDVSLEAFDRLALDRIERDPALLAAALRAGSVALRPEGARALRAYVAGARRDPVAARAALANALARIGR
jgi:hypothetical protein